MFPVYKDRMPIQLLAYLRLTRIQDSAQLALVKPLLLPRLYPRSEFHFMRTWIARFVFDILNIDVYF